MRNVFITCEFKGFSTWGERDTIFLRWLLLHRQLSTQPTRGARRTQSRLASPSSERNSTNCFFSNLSPRFPCVTSPKYPGLNSYLGFLFWHLWMTHPLRTRGNTCVLLHLTNPWAKRKVLSLTKPKGKIYKMKSLGNYITYHLTKIIQLQPNSQIIQGSSPINHTQRFPVMVTINFFYTICLTSLITDTANLLSNSSLMHVSCLGRVECFHFKIKIRKEEIIQVYTWEWTEQIIGWKVHTMTS